MGTSKNVRASSRVLSFVRRLKSELGPLMVKARGLCAAVNRVLNTVKDIVKLVAAVLVIWAMFGSSTPRFDLDPFWILQEGVAVNDRS